MNIVQKVLKAVTIVESLLLSIILFSIRDIPCTIAGFLMLIACISVIMINRKGN